MEAARGQKHPSEAKNGMKESIHWKKLLIKVAQQPQKPHDGSNQIWATTSGQKVMIFEAIEVTVVLSAQSAVFLYFYKIVFDQDQNSIKSGDIADCLKKTHLEIHKNKTNELSNNWQIIDEKH